ncbi:MAG: hypothetical protein ACI30N_06215, partial [Muribaculaceae bacterium]
EIYEINSEDGTVCPDESCDIRVDGLRLYCNQKSNDYNTEPDNDKRDTQLLKDGYSPVWRECHNRQLYVKEINGKYGLFDRFRREVFPPEYDRIEQCGEPIIEGTIHAYKDDECYLIFL